MSCKICRNLSGLILLLAGIALLLSACDDPSGPGNTGEPSLSIADYSHYHCVLEWTQLDLDGWEHDSYELYRSETPGVSSDTTRQLVAVYSELDEVLHRDEALEPATTYYYALLTRMHNSSTTDIDTLWSEESYIATHEVIHVEVVNNSGHVMYLAVHQADDSDNGNPVIYPWLKNIGDKSEWTEDEAEITRDSCVCTLQPGETLIFKYPEYVQPSDYQHGARILIGAVDSILCFGSPGPPGPHEPDLASATFLYDKVESGWPHTGNNTAVWNTTCVDFVAFPTTLQLNGGTSIGFTGETRQSLMTSLGSMASPFDSLAGPGDGSGYPIRYFSPGYYYSIPTHNTACLANALEAGLANHEGVTWISDNFKYTSITYIDSTNTMTAICQQTGHPDTLVTATEITSSNVLACAIPVTPAPATGSACGPRFGALIAAAANRGVLYDSNKFDSPDDYYVADTQGNHGEFNLYSMILHEKSAQGLCYGMAYDDLNEQSTSLNVAPGNTVTITINAFGY